jgi:hypothetical protein
MKCPGQDRRYWTGEPTRDMPCPKCGSMVELFRDEGTGRCSKCGHRFPNPEAVFGCAQWCPQAQECVGIMPLVRAPQGSSDRAVAARLSQAAEKELADDPPRLAHAFLAFQHAKQLLEREGGDPSLTLAAALLLSVVPDDPTTVDVATAAKKCFFAQSTRGRRILEQAGFQNDRIGSVCQLVSTCKSGRERDTIELKIVSDADRLARLTTQEGGVSPQELDHIIQHELQTSAGKQRARELFSEPTH